MKFRRSLGKWLKYVLTDANDNWDLAILFWVYAVVLFLYKATVNPPPFDFMNFGAGCAGVFIAGKALDWLTDRHNKNDDSTGTTQRVLAGDSNRDSSASNPRLCNNSSDGTKPL